MPRFSFGDEPQAGGPTAFSPGGFTSPTPHFGGNRNEPPTSVQLVCLSPDGTFLHSLGGGGSYIETQRLPINTQRDDRADLNETDAPNRIRTPLPEWIKSALRIDPPLELFCTEGESLQRKVESDPRQGLPQLCLYTMKSAYLLELAYEKYPEGQQYADPVQGMVVSVAQPYEPYLESSLANEILRIRPAPQRRNGFCTMCPGASIAALVFNSDFHEYSLLLHHSNGKVTRPLVFGMECLEDRDREQIVDFCFARSNELSLFSSLSIILLKGSGDLLSASPVVFDGAVVSSSSLREGLDYLADVIDSTDRASAKWRQGRAAQQYLLDVFGGRPSGRERYSTARIVTLTHQPSAAVNWPVQLQGPVLFHSSHELCPPALVVENFGNHASFVGVAVGRMGYSVDLAVISPSCLVPRFSFESVTDARDINDIAYKLGAWVERLELSSTEQHSTAERAIALVPDPLMDSLLHYATPRSVITVSTNAMRLAGSPRPNAVSSVRTLAWSCLQTSNQGAPLHGILVCRGTDDGAHELLAFQSDGAIVDVNLTELQFKNEVDMLFRGSSQNSSNLAITNGPGNQALANLDSTAPLFESIGGLVEKVKSGLAGMGRIVGSGTNYKDITADTLAVAVRIKERCDNEVVLPLLELDKLVKARRARLQVVVESHRKQLDALLKADADQKRRQQEIVAKIEAVESNAVILVERATSAQQGCNDIIPKVTDAENAFFKDIERVKEKCSLMESQLQRAKQLIASQCEAMSESTISDSLKPINPETATKANVLLNDQEHTLKTIHAKLKDVENQTGKFLA